MSDKVNGALLDGSLEMKVGSGRSWAVVSVWVGLQFWEVMWFLSSSQTYYAALTGIQKGTNFLSPLPRLGFTIPAFLSGASF